MFATTPLDTRAALTTASKLAGGLGATLRVIVPEVVSYGMPADARAADRVVVVDRIEEDRCCCSE